MPLDPSSYSKIFKSKYVKDDDDEGAPVDLRGHVDDDLDETPTPTYTPSVPAYSNPKVQELLSKPKLNFDRIFSSRYIDDGSSSLYTPPASSANYSNASTPTQKSSYSNGKSYEPTIPSKYSTAKDYDKIFTSKYLEEKPSFQKGINPYIQEEDSDDETPVRHLPPSRASSMRRASSLRCSSVRRSYDESAPFAKTYEQRPLKNLAVVSRAITPSRSSLRSESPSLSYRSTKSTTPAPRRIYPQSSASYDLDDLHRKEEAPVVFDANLTFILGCKGQMRQNVRPVPAHQESDTQSSALSSKISDFLKRTDHVMEEWHSVGGKRKKEDTSLRGKSRSATNIMIKGFQLYSKANSVGRSSVGKDSQNDDNTQDEIDEVVTTTE